MNDSSVKRVAFFIGTLAKGGAERAVASIVNRLPSDFDSEIILYGKHNRIDYPVNSKLVYIDEIKKNTVFNKFFSIFRRARNLKRMKLEHPDMTFISFLEYPNLLNLLTANFSRTIISVRNHMSTKNSRSLKGFFWLVLIRLLYNRADRIIAVSQDIRTDLIKNFKILPQKIQVIYNYYDLNAIRKQALESPPEELRDLLIKPTIVSMGRLNWQKGHGTLIRAFQGVVLKHPDAQLLILGEGPLEAKLKRLSEELKIKKNVHFGGYLANPHAVIARSTGFVLPSVVEGFPNALAEAMACGVPVIATDCHSGPRELLAPHEFELHQISYVKDLESSQRFGVLVPVGDGKFREAHQSLTETEKYLSLTINRLLDDQVFREQLSARSSQRIAEFDIKQVISVWEDLIRSPSSLQHTVAKS